ncbi:cytochrome c1-like isoform X2 [Solea solea]|uniref:cytochrome c1-like isoform X2 n=1 Tax=Solea solea TaxID=90069 RepID=UPI00272B4965|nr:cytochrome c1-like isoform X2 [Solea solea]
MFCRRLLQRVTPLTRRSLNPTCRDAVSVRHMAFGIPGGSTSMTYFLLCGGGLTAAVVYAYKTVSGDSKSYENTPADMDLATKVSLVVAESVPPPAEETAEPVAEAVSEDAADVVVLEAPTVAEEAPAEKEAEPEAASVGAEVIAIVEAPAVAEEAPAEKGAEPEAASVGAEVTAIVEAPAVAEEAPAEKGAEPEAASVAAEVIALVETPAEDAEDAAVAVEDTAADITGTATLEEISPVPSTEVEVAPASEVAA